MNCQEFETIVNDLAGGRLWDGAQRERGLDHTGECARCAARLANERLLTFELTAAAREERLVQAPVHLRQELLAAFAAKHAAPAVPPAGLVPFPVAPVPSANHGRYWATAIAAAAIVALALGLTLRGWFGGNVPEQAKETPGVKVPHEVVAPSPMVAANDQVTTPDPTRVERTPAVAAIRANPRRHSARRLPAAPGLNNSDEVAANTEVTSGFIPLTYLNSATAADGGVVLRVEVSRDKLAAMGLPLNLERSGETIKADIIVGDDGVARAIRLVQ